MLNFQKNLIVAKRIEVVNKKSISLNLCQLSLSNDTHMTVMIMRSKRVVLALATMCLGVTVNLAQAGERESLEQLRSTTVNLVNLLVQEGVLSKAKADDLLRQATQDAAKAREKDALSESEKAQTNTQEAGIEKAIDEKIVRVRYVPDIVKNQIKDEVKKEVMTTLNYKAGTRLGLPDWLDRISWEGDTRLRYQLDRFPGSNPRPYFFNADPYRNSNIENTTEDRSRFRVRARLGANVKVNDWLSGGLRIVTGNLTDPTTTTQTLESADSKYTIGLDRAFLKAQPYPWLSIVGGRFSNPWFHTDLVWDADFAFDGVATTITPQINDRLSSFLTIGAFPIDEINTSDTRLAKSKWLYGTQAGIQWKSENKSSIKIGLAYYDFANVQGQSNGVNLSGPFDLTVPSFRQKGNNTFDINAANPQDAKFGLASKFQEINLTGEIDLAKFDPVHIILTGDYVRNIGFDQKEILSRTGRLYNEETDAYQLKLAVGMPKTLDLHDWQVFGAYKKLEADSMMDAFTDSNFHLGGTDAKGWILGAHYGVGKNAWMTARYFSSEAVTGLPNGLPLSIDVLMLDLNAKF